MKKTDKIIAILKEFEQEDKNNVSNLIPSEKYEAIAKKIYNDLIIPEIASKRFYRKQMNIAKIHLQDYKDCGY